MIFLTVTLDFRVKKSIFVIFQNEINTHKRLESSPTISVHVEDDEMKFMRPLNNILRKMGLQTGKKRRVVKHRAQDFFSGNFEPFCHNGKKSYFPHSLFLHDPSIDYANES